VPVISDYRVEVEATVKPGRMRTQTVACQEGDILTGGGYAISTEFRGQAYRVNSNAPRGDEGLEWLVRIENLDSTDLVFYARAICLQVEP
jgi:hypothetical protein